MIRMIRTITLLTAALGLITSAIAAQAADAHFQIAPPSQKSIPTYSLTDTGSFFSPGSGERSARGINFLGHVVGFERIEQIVHPFLYANGRSIDLTPLLPPLGGNPLFGNATAINIRDQVVGYHASPQSFLYKNGKALIFGMPNSLWTRATSINDFGQIVG